MSNEIFNQLNTPEAQIHKLLEYVDAIKKESEYCLNKLANGYPAKRGFQRLRTLSMKMEAICFLFRRLSPRRHNRDVDVKEDSHKINMYLAVLEPDFTEIEEHNGNC